uniref:N-acetyltransferase domain-containing protein n=1 Tax=Chloropicon primus TaxID=1764295 RepID=A0A7S2X0S0_9CHLO
MAYVVDLESRSHLVEHVLPLRGKLKTGQLVELSLLKKPFDMGDFQALHEIFEEIIEEGVSYPQQGPVTAEAFRVYYTSHDVFVLREASSREILGAFYVKPNFPGRCSHICNHGFMVPSRFRNRGIGTVMARHSLFLSKLLGYKAVYYNLVFTDNKHAIHAYKKLGFQQTGKQLATTPSLFSFSASPTPAGVLGGA